MRQRHGRAAKSPEKCCQIPRCDTQWKITVRKSSKFLPYPLQVMNCHKPFVAV